MSEVELIVIKGLKKGMRFSLKEDEITIGRGKDNTIVLEDARVSRHHCCIVRHEADKYEMRDLNSTNKTLINDTEIRAKDLVAGDQIQVGSTLFLFTTVKDAERISQEEILKKGTRLITVTEMKIAPEESRILDSSIIGDNMEALKKAHKDLAIIYKIGTLINSIQDTEELLNILADKLVEVMRPDRVVLMLFGNGRGKVVNRVVRTKYGTIEGAGDISMSMVHEATSEGMAILSYDALADERFKHKQSVILNRIRSAMCVPIKSRDMVWGVIYIDTHIRVGKFSEQDLQFLSIIANQAGIAIQNAKLYEDLDDLFTGSLKTLVATIEAKDPVTSGHSLRVTIFSLAIGKELGLSKDEMRILKISGLLHDIGKVGIPEAILGKPAPLSEDEFIRMREHSERGAEIIKNIKNVEEVVLGVRHHHERYDGYGMPDGLKAEHIPIISRIIAVADTFDAMAYDRPYRKGISIDKVVSEIERCSGTQFDPKIVDAFLKAYNKGNMKEDSEDSIS